MHFPFATFFAIVLLELYRETHGDKTASTDMATLTVNFAALLGVSYAVSHGMGRYILRKVAGGAAAQAIIRLYQISGLIQKTTVVGMYFAFLMATDWPLVIDDAFPPFAHFMLDDVAAIAPFVGALIVSWLASYRTDLVLSNRTWTLVEYITFQARYALLLILPWLAMYGFVDGLAMLPESWQNDFRPYQSLAVGAFLLVLFALAPVALGRLMGWRPLSEGPLRDTLQAFCKEHGYSVRDILVWETGNAKILTAGVMGIVAPLRYLLFTDTYLRHMGMPEIKAALAHELGHVRHRHMAKYVVLSIVFLGVITSSLALLPASWAGDRWLRAAVTLLLLLFFFRGLFGYISRLFERQADAESALMLGTPVPICLALERAAQLSEMPRDLFDWRHGSIAERVAFLYRAGFTEGALEEFNRYARAVYRACLIVGALLFGLCLWLQIVLADRALLQAEAYLHAEQYAEAHQWYQTAAARQAPAERLLRGMALLRANRDAGTLFDKKLALRYAKDVVEINDASWRNYRALALAQLANRKFADAKHAFQMAIERAPKREQDLLREEEREMTRQALAGP